MREGSKNGNWKGGLTKFKTADELLSMPKEVQDEVKKRLLANARRNLRSGCWNWIGAVFKKEGRAKLTLGTNFLASRLSYVIYKGTTNGLCVLHSCDNVLCINRHHLWLGTNADNSADMVAKGRAACGDRNGSRLHPEKLVRGSNHPNSVDPIRVQGERNGRALLTSEQVREIRKKYRPYINNHKPSNQRELAKEYGVGVHVIKSIVSCKTWRSVN